MLTAVKNGIIAEDAQPIEDQLQLPGQTAPPHEAKAGAVNEEEAVLVAMEAQEDLGSGEDLLAAPEPQPKPAACEEQTPAPTNSSAVEGSAEPEAAVAQVEPAEAVQAEASELVEEMVAEPVVERDISEPAMSSLVVEETPSEANAEAPAEEASSVQAEEPSDHPAPDAPTENEPNEPSAADEAPTPGVVSAPNEDAEPTERSEPAGVVEPFIDTGIAEATIPELPSSSAQTEPEPVTEEATQVSTAPSETAPPEEELYSTGVTSSAEQVQTLEVPAQTASETLSQAGAEAPPEGVTLESTADAPVVETILGQSEGPAAPEPAPEPSPEDMMNHPSSCNGMLKYKTNKDLPFFFLNNAFHPLCLLPEYKFKII